VVDATNRYGFYAISILFPQTKKINKGNVLALLDELSEQYWHNYVSSGKIYEGIQENVELFERILRKSEYQLVDYVSETWYNEGAEKTIAIRYKNEAELEIFFDNYDRFKIAPAGLIYLLSDLRLGQRALEFQLGPVISMPDIEPLRQTFDFVIRAHDGKGNLMHNALVRAFRNGEITAVSYVENVGYTFKQLVFDDRLRIEISNEGYQLKTFGEDIIQQYLNSHQQQMKEGKVTFDYCLVPINNNHSANNNSQFDGQGDNYPSTAPSLVNPPDESPGLGKIALVILRDGHEGFRRLKRFRIFQESGSERETRKKIDIDGKLADVFINTKDLSRDYRGIIVKKFGYKTVGKSKADIENHLKDTKGILKPIQIVLKPDWLLIIILTLTLSIVLSGALLLISRRTDSTDNYQSLKKAAGGAIEKMREDITHNDTTAAKQSRETAWQQLHEMQKVQHIRGLIIIRDSLQNLSLALSKSPPAEKELIKIRNILSMITYKELVDLADSLHKLDSVLLAKTRLKDSGSSGPDTQAIPPPPPPVPVNTVPKDLEQKINNFFNSNDYNVLNTGGALTLRKELKKYTLNSKEQHNLNLLNSFITLSQYIGDCNRQVAAREPNNKKINSLIIEKDEMRGLCRNEAQKKIFDNVQALLANKPK